MANSVIDIYDQDQSPNEQSLTDDTYNRCPTVVGDILYCGTAAITDGSTYRVELRTAGQVPVYGIGAYPTPTPVAAVQVADITAFMASIVGHPSGAVFFAIKSFSPSGAKVWRHEPPDLSGEDGVYAAELPLLACLREEIVATYNTKIRVRTPTGTWGDATVTPAPSTYRVKGLHVFNDVLYFFVDADYAGTRKAEVWKYTGNAAAITLDTSYTGSTFAEWNATYTAGGIFSGALYGCWNDSDSTHTIVKRTTAWSNVKTGVRIGEFVEFRGAIYGHYSTTLYSPGSDPTGTWATISSAFPADIISF